MFKKFISCNLPLALQLFPLKFSYKAEYVSPKPIMLWQKRGKKKKKRKEKEKKKRAVFKPCTSEIICLLGCISNPLEW